MKRKNAVLKWGTSIWMLCFFLVVFSIGAYAQPRTLTGKVVDETGFPLPGVTVLGKGTTVGTVTNADGTFSLSVPANVTVLQFSFVGMRSQEVTISGRTTFNIVMSEESIGLEEVVAVGYGTQKKETVVGSIAQVSDEELKRTGHTSDLRQALMGQLPGVVALTMSGEPGGILTGESATNIFIRGQNTWNGGQPLVLVDGVERNMNNIDVSEVASISVLKDASATAVFGVKGANGVILITTKRGTEGKTTLDFNYTATGSLLSKQPDKLDSYDAMMVKNEIIEREGVMNEPSWNSYVPYELVRRFKAPQTPEYALIYPNVDWEKEMYKDLAMSHRMTLSARGGSKAVQYFGSLAYLHEGDQFQDYDNGKGYEPNYNFDRFNFRSNIDIQLTNTTKFKINLAGFYSQKNTNYNNEGSTGRADSWMWRSTYGLAPNLFLPMYPNGRWGGYAEGGNNTVNPLAIVYNIGIRQTRTTELNSDFTLNQNLDFITKGLSATASLFYDNTIRSEGGIYDNANSARPGEAATNTPYTQVYWQNYTGPDQDPSEYMFDLPVSDEEYDWVIRPWTLRNEAIAAANWQNYIPIYRRLMYQGQINYARRFDAHNVAAMGIFKREEYARGSMFKNYREDWVFRTTYDYDARYLLEVNGAYNGSEQFGPGYRFDFFPSVAVGWYLSNESFYNVPWLNNLKLRYSMGRVGDDNVSGRWLYASQFAYGGTAILHSTSNGRSPYVFYRQSIVGNPNVHWENALKTNLGVEMGFLQNLFTLNFDYFTEDRTDILLAGGSRNIPPFFGATPPSANLGHVKSNGFELELGFNKKLRNNVNLWANLAITHNENTILERDDAPLQFEYLKNKGYPIGQQKRQIKLDMYQSWDDIFASVPTENNDLQKLPGYFNILDFNADGIIKSSEDTPPVGYSEIPQNTGSLTLGSSYKGLSFMVQFYGVNNANRWISFNNFNYDTDIVFGHVRDYWDKETNPDGTSFLPRWKTQAENTGDFFLYDASYLRLRMVELAYSLNNLAAVKNAGFSNLRVFLNGNNLFFWSKLPDDREQTYVGGDATTGSYPTVKRINLGLELTF